MKFRENPSSVSFAVFPANRRMYGQIDVTREEVVLLVKGNKSIVYSLL